MSVYGHYGDVGQDMANGESRENTPPKANGMPFTLDRDTLLVGALLLLLLRDGGDKKLLLALAYILF